MEFIETIQTWAKGDALQGKIMIGAGVFLLLSIFFFLKSDHPILKGMVFPITFITIILLAYGSFLATTRINYATESIKKYQTNPQELIQTEITKANRDNNNYSKIKPFWGVLIIVAVLLFFVFTKDYYIGLSLGMLVFLTGALIVDTLLHHRLKPFLKLLNQLQ